MQQDDVAVVITQQLGRVFSGEEHLVLCTGNPSGNSTRWVFDIDQDTSRVPCFSFQLLSWSGRRIYASIVSFSLTPLSSSFWDARPFIACPTLPDIEIRADRLPAGVPIRYRVAMDLVHSTSR